MSFIIGRGEGDPDALPAARLGSYRALDGSRGASLFVDLDGPHAALVVGKRGYGKSYTMGVLAEELARTDGIAPTVIDPMGVFGSIADRSTGKPVPATVIDEPRIAPESLDPRSWCALLGLSPESGAGGLVWQAAGAASGLQAMIGHVDTTDANEAHKRSAINHLRLAGTWNVFDPAGIDAADLAGPEVTVIDISGLDSAPMNAVVRGVGEALYRARVDETVDRLPWLLIDEAHTFFEGVARDTLERLLTRGRAPGVSLLLATQRPSAVSEVAISQSDILVSHRLTAEADLAALEAAQPSYMDGSLAERLPHRPGEVVVIDDATETIHAARVRSRDTPHDGDSPSAGDVTIDS